MTRTYSARLGRKTLTVTIAKDGAISAVDAGGIVYLADGKTDAQGCADVTLYRGGITAAGRLIVDADRAYFA